MPTFNASAMRKLVETDHYLNFVFKDLSKRNPNMKKEDVLEIVFNSNVLEDSELLFEYEKCGG